MSLKRQRLHATPPTADRYQAVKDQLPPEVTVLADAPYFMQNLSRHPTLVLLGRLK